MSPRWELACHLLCAPSRSRHFGETAMHHGSNGGSHDARWSERVPWRASRTATTACLARDEEKPTVSWSATRRAAGRAFREPARESRRARDWPGKRGLAF